MRRATTLIHADNWTSDEILGTVTLAYADRHRRRIKMKDDNGASFLLDLADVVQLEEGDALVLEEGGVIEVKAAFEDVLDIQCLTIAESAQISWHIGNRHTPLQVLDSGKLRITYDHVLQHMIEGLGATTKRKMAIFSPEKGAYSSGGYNHED
ncbi:MAG: urease accessory protein UreE [Rhodospirillales bacterium]|jgi:urease accessory protein